MIQTRPFSHGPEARWTFRHQDEGQFLVLRQGVCALKTDEGQWLVLPGHPCWIPPRASHGLQSSGVMTGQSLLLDEALSRAMPAEPRVYQPRPLLMGLIDRIAEVDPGSDRLQRLLAVLADEAAESDPDPLHLPLPKTAGLRVMASVLATEPANERSIDEWCEAASISKRTFVRRFPAETGLTFVEWRRRARVMKAVELLRQGHGVAEAAPEVGYDSVSAFISSFRQVTGLSPRQFAIATTALTEAQAEPEPANPPR